MHRKSVLSNGLRVVTEELPFLKSAALGVWLDAGSRDEAAPENGLTHFLEHMAFKGTASRSALDIAREIDRVGGSCNAFTGKEQTCFHTRVLGEHLARGVNLLADLVLHPGYRADDLEKERQVILEEILSQDDNPEDLVQVEFARHFWRDHPFGRPILGEQERISRVTREELLDYRRAAYRPEKLVVAAAGKVNHQELVDLVGPRFENFHNGAPASHPRELPATFPGIYLFPRDLEQVYLCLGTRGPAAGDEQRFAATVLNTILGGNMSSRLFQKVREELGLVYSIYSFLSFFSDTGLFGICVAVSPQNLEEVLAVVCRELKQAKLAPISAAELKEAQEFLKGSIYLNTEDGEHRMMRLAKNEIHFGHYIPLEDIVAGLMLVSAAEIQELARELLRPEDWALALLGPVEKDFGRSLDF